MDTFYLVLLVAFVVGLYRMMVAETRWISFTGITISMLIMFFLAMNIGYKMHDCEIAPVDQYAELRVSNPPQLYKNVQSPPF